jgi:hypothetical protein
MHGRLLVLAPLLLLLTACRQEQLLTVAHAAGSDEDHPLVQPAPEVLPSSIQQAAQAPHPSRHAARTRRQPGLHDSCYAYILMRPKVQRANAVQARLSKADAIEEAFGTHTVDVDLLGDHANIMALQFPSAWPDYVYARRISTVIEEYLSSPEILDYMCGAGFAEVRLSARAVSDGKMHLLWTARVTAEGLVKNRHTVDAALEHVAAQETASAQSPSNLKPD